MRGSLSFLLETIEQYHDGVSNINEKYAELIVPMAYSKFIEAFPYVFDVMSWQPLFRP